MVRFAMTMTLAFSATVSFAQTDAAPATTAAPAAAEQQTLQATVVESGGTTTCTQGSMTRTVSIASKEPGKAVPCEVHYKKENGSDQVIYTANVEASFCETKAKAFVEKLTGMGWTCQ